MSVVLTRRERLRTQALAEIGALAMAQVAAGGPSALSLAGIAREMGMSGPAMYRYYASRDALLARLVADAYVDLAGAMARDIAAAPLPDDPEHGLRAVAGAYRAWALAHAREYVLLTAGVPADQPRAELEAATRRALDLVVAALADLGPRTAAASPPRWLLTLAVIVWQRLHGHLALELEGIHAAMGLDSDELYEEEVRAVVAQTRARWADGPDRPGGGSYRCTCGGRC